MKIALATLSARFALSALLVAPFAQAQSSVPATQVNVAAVNTSRLVSESRLAKEAGAKIIAEFSKREKAIADKMSLFRAASDKFNTEGGALNDRERTTRARELMEMEKDVQHLQAEFRDDLRQRQNEERSAIAQKAFTILTEIARQEHIDVVVQDPFWFSPRIDITDKILKQLDK